MKNFLIFLPVTILFLSFKSTIAPGLPLPDITVLAVLFMAYERSSVEGVVLSFVLGYVEDVFNGGIIGTTAFSLVFIYAAVHIISRRVHFSNPSVRAALAGTLTLTKGILIWILLSLTDLDVPFLPRMLLAATVTGLFAPVFIAFFTWLKAVKIPGVAGGGQR